MIEHMTNEEKGYLKKAIGGYFTGKPISDETLNVTLKILPEMLDVLEAIDSRQFDLFKNCLNAIYQSMRAYEELRTIMSKIQNIGNNAK